MIYPIFECKILKSIFEKIEVEQKHHFFKLLIDLY